VGIQGTGKSLTAKAIAHHWHLPLLRLDVGRLFAGLIGESESRTRQMIQLSEALAPCILWIDEIDKAFAGVDGRGDSGTSSRVFGTFITWMAEKTSPVFVVATANNIQSLPPELLRRGRFDEIFFVGLPTQEERKAIYEVHLSRLRAHNLQSYDLERLAYETPSFSGPKLSRRLLRRCISALVRIVTSRPKTFWKRRVKSCPSLAPLRNRWRPCRPGPPRGRRDWRRGVR
jgi:SpoVK/Ycf46/Vps4 family AAA+-type ATPase